MRQSRHSTASGIQVVRSITKLPYKKGLSHLLRDLDTYRGIYLSSGYEYPGRYSRWDIASVRPPLEILAGERWLELRPLNPRGEVLNRLLFPVLAEHPHWESLEQRDGALVGRLKPLPALFPEEQRSKQPSAFSILRALTEEFRPVRDPRLALVGAFGYDLLFQFDPVQLRLPRTGRGEPAPLPVRRHLLHGPQAGADRALSVRLRKGRPLYRAPGTLRRPHSPGGPASVRRDRQRPRGRTSTWRRWRPSARG